MRHQVENLAFLGPARITDLELEHEAIDLRLGQGIGSFLFNWILGGENQERFLQFEGLIADGDLFFLHGLEQRTLNLGRGAVDFIGQNEIGEERSAPGGESAGLRIVDLGADQVGGEQVGRELEAGEFDAEAGRQRFDRESFGEAGDAFEEDVAVGEEPDDEPFDEILLAYDDLAEFAEERSDKGAGRLDFFVDCSDAGVHVIWSLFPAYRQANGKKRSDGDDCIRVDGRIALSRGPADLGSPHPDMDEPTRTDDESNRDGGQGISSAERDFLRALLDNIPDSVYFKDKDSRFIHCSHEVVARLGLSSVKEVIGRTDADFFSPEFAAMTLEDERRIMRTGNPMIGVIEREIRLNGAVNWVLTTKVPFRDKSGTVIGTFGISRDITELKKSQEDQANEKELLAVTLKSIGDVVVTTDIEGGIVLFNKAAEDLTGLRQAQARGRRVEEIMTLVDQQTRRPIENPVQKVIDHRSHYGRSNNVILRMPDGMDRVLALNGAPIFDNEGKMSGVVLAFHDMTEKQRIETEIFKASKLESVGTLAGGIAHDFNNILTTIIGNLSLAKMPGMDPEKLLGRIGDAERAALKARELTHRLLTFSKGGAPIKKSIELGPLIEGVVHSTLRGGNVAGDIAVPSDLWMVEVDEGQMKHVINHLVMNARDAMAEGGKVAVKAENVEIKADFLPTLAAGSCVKITVRDTGAGIAPEHLSRIFDPYFTTKEQGAGLGLATSYSIIRKHDGIIQVDSLPGIGTVFTIYLRASKLGAVPVAESRLGLLMGSGRILLMDDEADIRTVGLLILQTIGYEVELARDGAECIECYLRARSEARPFDAIILDLTIANGMGGKETIRRLRAVDPNVKAIVSSGYSLDPVMANFREYGFNGVVPKPYKIEDMAGALKDLLRP